MNYYEELAVAQDASLEEIHHAYRGLARLLHPDNQSDPKLKSTAERQMIRLNEMLAILADPEKRRKYDESLRTNLAVSEAIPPPPPASTSLLGRQTPWILACCIVAGVGLWYWRSNEFAGPLVDRSPAQLAERPVNSAHTSSSARTPPVSEIQSLSSESRLSKRVPVRLKPSEPPDQVSAGENSAASELVSRFPKTNQPAAALPDVASKTVAPPLQLSPAAPEAPAQSQRLAGQSTEPAFGGRWLYALGAHDAQTPGMYPPEFIEFFLSEQHGVLSGKYWGRYRIPDKPISPEVRLRVYGALQKDGIASAKWVSDDGAGGLMRIVLRDSTSMEVTWWTTTFGRETALTSGTAVLVRQLAR
jgi:curved DNA-binding protein CbpA